MIHDYGVRALTMSTPYSTCVLHQSHWRSWQFQKLSWWGCLQATLKLKDARINVPDMHYLGTQTWLNKPCLTGSMFGPCHQMRTSRWPPPSRMSKTLWQNANNGCGQPSVTHPSWPRSTALSLRSWEQLFYLNYCCPMLDGWISTTGWLLFSGGGN